MLSFQMKTDSFDISQDVAITLQSAKRKIDFDEPVLDAPDVKVAMPELKALVSVIERMKLITDDELVLTASENGNLSLQVEADQVKIKTFYTGNLNRPGAPSMSQQVSQLSQSRNAGKTITQTVDIKKFARILQCRTLSDMAEKFIGCKDPLFCFCVSAKNTLDAFSLSLFVMSFTSRVYLSTGFVGKDAFVLYIQMKKNSGTGTLHLLCTVVLMLCCQMLSPLFIFFFPVFRFLFVCCVYK